MELMEFISTVFVEIFEDIVEARTATQKHGGLIGAVNKKYEYQSDQLKSDDVGVTVSTVDFEVVLAEAQSQMENKRRGIGVFLSKVGVGAENEKGGNSASQTSIKFSIPLVLPPASPK